MDILLSQLKEAQPKETQSNEERNYLVYCLVSTVHPNQTYVGSTNNWTRRIRQHNGFITGGARRTLAHRPWGPLFHVTGLTKKEALQLEWAIKHRRKKGFSGPKGRIVTLEFLLFSGTVDKWTNKSISLKTLEVDTYKLNTPYSLEKWSMMCLPSDRPLKNVSYCSRHFEKEIMVPEK